MADYIHEEIIINILHRLPVKILLRCTAVCKSWYTLITTPQFISSHLKFAAACKNKSSLLLLRRCIKNSERYDLYLDNIKSFTHHTTYEFPFTSMNSFFTIVGSCNGLLCISDDRVYYMNTIILWNPSIKRSVLLPNPNMIYNSHGSFTQCLGFGFDSIANDYKVVRITYVDLVRKPQIEVYKLRNGVWRDMSYLELDSDIYNRSRQVYVNGASHWIGRNMDLYDVIVVFDLSHDVFRTMMLPASVANDDVLSKDLVVCEDSLSLVLWNVESFCVWVMQEYGVEESWSKRFSFDLRNLENGFMRPLWIREGGEVAVVLQEGRLISCNHGGEVEDLGLDGSRSHEYTRALHACNYTSSLALLERRLNCSCGIACKNMPSVEIINVGSSRSDYEVENDRKRSC